MAAISAAQQEGLLQIAGIRLARRKTSLDYSLHLPRIFKQVGYIGYNIRRAFLGYLQAREAEYLIKKVLLDLSTTLENMY